MEEQSKRLNTQRVSWLGDTAWGVRWLSLVGLPSLVENPSKEMESELQGH